MEKSQKYSKWIFILLNAILYYHIGYVIVRNNFGLILFDFTLLFTLYFFALKNIDFDWFTVISLRFVFLFSIPSLSDDFYRFIWDGSLTVSGQNPFQSLPSDLTPTANYQHLNSKHYYSVYPPLLQIIFALGAFIGKNNLLTNVIILRLIIIAADLVSIYLIAKLLKHFNRSTNQVLLYALNPLIIVELTGNLHFEAVMLCFLLLAIWFLSTNYKSKYHLFFSAFFLACSILIKLLPLIFIPLIFNKLGWKKGLYLSSIAGILIVLAFIPFIKTTLLMHIFKSINLYFQKFEFNASIYYIVKWAGIHLNNNNPIQTAGPLLSGVGSIIILWISFKKILFIDAFFTKMLLIISIYFFLATTVHPWYICTLVGLSCFTNFRYPIAWSFLAIFSYSTYQSINFQENLWLTGLEYMVVFGMICWEWNREYLDQLVKKKLAKSNT